MKKGVLGRMYHRDDHSRINWRVGKHAWYSTYVCTVLLS